jgi:quercetin dioxygenase-like cupin family protein
MVPSEHTRYLARARRGQCASQGSEVPMEHKTHSTHHPTGDHHGHKEDSDVGQSSAGHGITPSSGHGHGNRERKGDKWWPNEASRVAELVETEGRMSPPERAAGERELAARSRRAAAPPVIRRETIQFRPSSYKGVEVGAIIDPSVGLEVRNTSLAVHRLLPGAHTELHRHSERVVHVLNGTGYSILDGTRYDWAAHDSMHIQNGAWHQHVNSSETEPAHLMVAAPTPIVEHFSPHAMVYLGDSFSDQPEDYRPEHPFTGERVAIELIGGQKWMGRGHATANSAIAEREERRRAARVFMPAVETVLERSEHKGDFRVGLVDEYLGFANRILAMYVHQLPPDSHTETHKHGEAIVYVLSGRGHSIVEGERLDWRSGDCIFVQPGQWHQHVNDDPERASQHLAFYVAPIRDRIVRGAEDVEWVTEPGYDPPAGPDSAGEWWRS